jgi:hypothetical protein
MLPAAMPTPLPFAMTPEAAGHVRSRLHPPAPKRALHTSPWRSHGNRPVTIRSPESGAPFHLSRSPTGQPRKRVASHSPAVAARSLAATLGDTPQKPPLILRRSRVRGSAFNPQLSRGRHLTPQRSVPGSTCKRDKTAPIAPATNAAIIQLSKNSAVGPPGGMQSHQARPVPTKEKTQV